ncbi:unnamed protein product [Allacma fusca]|uniref:Uncharacterized protein n=1 Tax=Allacma fusca TaxID=39272 RepID=A0A8J2PQT4_9HEXA|nr:unnamed protein product [Allacma fusca]
MAVAVVVATLLAIANAGLLAAPGAFSVVRTGLPIGFAGSPALVHAAPVAKAYAPLTFTGPAHIRIARGLLTGPSVLAAPLAYAQPALVHGAPVAVAAPVSYHTPLVYSPAVQTVQGHFLV